MKAVSRTFKAYQASKSKVVSPFEYPDVGNYKGMPTCMNLITEGEMSERCIEDYHYCRGRVNCPYSPADPQPSFIRSHDFPDVDEIYDFYSHLPIPVKEVPKLPATPVLKLLTNDPVKEEPPIKEVVIETNPAKQRTRHGCSRHPLYVKWVAMCNSCYDDSHPNYPKVGAKGIRVCERWHDVRNFIEDFKHYEANAKMRFKRLDKFKDFKPDNYILS